MSYRVVSAKSAAGFRRAGMAWPREGRRVAVADLDDATWKRLMDEPMLDIRAASADEAAPQADASPGPVPAVVEALVRIIPALAAEDFTRDGQPRRAAMRAAVPEVDPALVTGAARDAAMAILAEGGFTPPAA